MSVYIWDTFFHGGPGLCLNKTDTNIENSVFTSGRGIAIAPNSYLVGGAMVIINSTIWITISTFTSTQQALVGRFMQRGNIFRNNIAEYNGEVVSAFNFYKFCCMVYISLKICL